MDESSERRITALEANRNFGRIQEQAAEGPVIGTHHGRARLAILSIDAYDRLRAAARAGTEEAEQRARERAKLLLILDSISEGYFSLDRDWRVTTVNRVAEQYVGRPRGDMLGRRLQELFPKLRGTSVEAQLRRVLEQGEAVDFPFASVLHPGRRLEVHGFPLPLSGGGVGVLFVNVGARDRLIERIRLLEARGRLLTGVTPDLGVVLFDDDGRITDWDGGAEALLGGRAEERLGASIETLFEEADRRAGRLWAEMAAVRRGDWISAVRRRPAGRRCSCAGPGDRAGHPGPFGSGDAGSRR